jgi:hypothetical protein
MARQNLVQVTTSQQIPNQVYEDLLKSAQKSVKIKVGTVPIDAAQDAFLEFCEYIGQARVFLDVDNDEYFIRLKNYDSAANDGRKEYLSVNIWVKTVAKTKALDFMRKKANVLGSHVSIDTENDLGNSGQHLLDINTNDDFMSSESAEGQEAVQIGQVMSDVDELITSLDYDPQLYDYIIVGFDDCLALSYESFKKKKPSKSVKVVNEEDEEKKQALMAEYLYIFTRAKFTEEESVSHNALCEELGLIMVDSVAGNFKAKFMGLVSICLKSKLTNYITADSIKV